MLISTLIFLFFLFLTYALFLIATRKSDARSERLQQRVSEALQAMGVVELIVIARSMMPVLSQLAENVLIERGADHLVGDLPARSLARATTETLLQRL